MTTTLRSLLVSAAAGLVLAGCAARQEAAPVPTPSPEQAADKGSCGAEKLASYVGMMPTPDVMAKIKAASGAELIRVLGPHSMMTMDYRLDRLTVETGADGKITRFRCV
jgi:hypothetical protein